MDNPARGNHDLAVESRATDGRGDDGSWRHLVLYDGECGLCQRSVAWLVRHDRRARLHYAPLQGDTARPFVGEAAHFDTIVLLERAGDGGVRRYERSRAALRLAFLVGGVWRALSWLRLLPAWLTDLPYRLVARHRLRLFGRADACAVPPAAARGHFLP